MNSIDIPMARLASQRLVGPRVESPAEVLRWLGAVQAQDYLGALWAIGVRTRGAKDNLIEEAISDRSIVRTWFMRGTLHFLAANDYRWMIDLMGERMRRSVDGIARTNKAGLDEAKFVKSNEVIVRALAGGKLLTRDEIGEALESAGISINRMRLGLLLQRAQSDGLICYGPRRGKQFTLVLVDDWLPSSSTKSREEALAEFARRYFQSHGPATIEDYAWWSGLTLTDARAGLDAASDELETREVDGQTYWMEPTEATAESTAHSAHLLWGFDEYLVGYKDRSAMFSAQNIDRARALGGGMLRPIVVINGRVVGNWRRRVTKTRVNIEIDPFERTSASERRHVAQAAEMYGHFLGLPVQMSSRATQG